MESYYKEKYFQLNTEYDKLNTEYNKLKHEFSENVIIQSMNSMKAINSYSLFT